MAFIKTCLNSERGSIRETFLLNQLHNIGTYPKLPTSGDLVVSDTYIEIGGRQKSGKQVNTNQHHLIAADDMPVGYQNKVPLWLFGFMY